MHRTVYSAWAIALGLITQTIAQTVSPSNSSQDLYPVATSPRFLLNGSEFPDLFAIRLAPLGDYAEMSHGDFVATELTGQLIQITAANVNDNFGRAPRRFFYVSCDPEDYEGNLQANEVFTMATNNDDAFLIILYTTRSDHCTGTGLTNVPALASIMTTTEPMAAEMLAEMNLGPSSPGTATLVPDLNAYTNDTESGNRSWYGQGRGPNGSPTTAVAMIILYSITGVITALFVTIIITGAIRAHRHPERYGPRVAGIGGRGRQGRARGIARAVVDSLPIVKFGDRDGDAGGASGAQKTTSVANSTTDAVAPSNDTARDGDIEMTAGLPATTSPNNPSPTPANATDATATQDVAGTTPTATAVAHPKPPSSSADPTPEDEAPSCSICTEDFTIGSDLRVLPCGHRFHPECVDPWLLNVSGTCPLCRIDLRPKDATAATTEEGDAAAGADGNARASAESAQQQGRSGSTSQAGGFRPGEDHIMAFSLRSGRSRGASLAYGGRRSSVTGPAADRSGSVSVTAESAGALATLRRAMAGSREERVAALRRFREQAQAQEEGAGTAAEGSEEAEQQRRGMAARLRERWRVRTVRRGEPGEQTLGQIRSREHVNGRPV